MLVLYTVSTNPRPQSDDSRSNICFATEKRMYMVRKLWIDNLALTRPSAPDRRPLFLQVYPIPPCVIVHQVNARRTGSSCTPCSLTHPSLVACLDSWSSRDSRAFCSGWRFACRSDGVSGIARPGSYGEVRRNGGGQIRLSKESDWHQWLSMWSHFVFNLCRSNVEGVGFTERSCFDRVRLHEWVLALASTMHVVVCFGIDGSSRFSLRRSCKRYII